MGLTDVHTGLSELLELLNRLGLGSDGSNDRGLLEVERERRKGQELRWADQGEIEKEMGGGTYLSEELVLISESVEAGEGREEERESQYMEGGFEVKRRLRKEGKEVDRR